MQTHHTISWFSQFTLLSVLLLLLFFKLASGFGSMGPISASFGESGFFCAIDASGKQEVVCWGTARRRRLPRLLCRLRRLSATFRRWLRSPAVKVFSAAFYPTLHMRIVGAPLPQFAFNASVLNEVDLTSLCVRTDLTICSPCGSNCSEGYFLSSSCTEHADRVCTACSLCQNSTCWDICGLQAPPEMKRKLWHHIRRLVIIFGWCFLPRLTTSLKEEGTKKQFKSCIGKPELEADNNEDSEAPLSVVPCPGMAQVFRLSEGVLRSSSMKG
ncbi:hypothetical protein ACLB2K_001035 [Fragaria x ananassa]